MATVVETFDPMNITGGSAQFEDEQESKKFGCLGSVSGETTLREIIKRCEGVEVDKIVKPEKMDLTISAHIKTAVLRSIFGISNEGLKPGVYSYATNSKGKKFIFTADVIDEFEDVTKLIAFPKCVSATGFVFTVENGGDEVAEMEITISAYPDEQKKIMYEAYVSELDDQTVADQWHSAFDYSLVEATPEV